MKIEGMKGYPVYRKTNNPAPVKSESGHPHVKKMDVAEFSHNQTPALDKNLLNLKSSILSEVSKPTDPSKLEELKARVRDGSYRPSADAIADAILSHKE